VRAHAPRRLSGPLEGDLPWQRFGLGSGRPGAAREHEPRSGEQPARSYTYEQNPRGRLGLVVDRQRELLVGAWAAAPLAGEWIHHAVLAIRAEIPLAVLRDTIAQFPTYSESYVSALRTLPGRTASGRR